MKIPSLLGETTVGSAGEEIGGVVEMELTTGGLVGEEIGGLVEMELQ
jgi:hypothetical protein